MTKRGMPSAAQMRVLEAIRDGKRWGIGGGYRASLATMRASKHAGWIVLDSGFFTLTNLGRHALEAARASKGVV